MRMTGGVPLLIMIENDFAWVKNHEKFQSTQYCMKIIDPTVKNSTKWKIDRI